jgi:hypothetical protein
LASSKLAAFLDHHSDFGLICPNYDGRTIYDDVVETNMTCGGRYDGSGGLAGFAMMLSSDLAKDWTFDETMMWWYGDDDVLMWTLSKGRKVGIVACAEVSENTSWTTHNDRPARFGEMVENDGEIFDKKWRSNAL